MEVLCRRIQKYDMGKILVAFDFSENRYPLFGFEDFLFSTGIAREDRKTENGLCG
jgi:hypothetical protein